MSEAASTRTTKATPVLRHSGQMRPDATRDTRTSRSITRALREAIRRRCSGAHFEGEFPRHVWGWLDGELYEARLINRARGWYKAWPIEEAERPKDAEDRLAW
jgi:hypothetical protein